MAQKERGGLCVCDSHTLWKVQREILPVSEKIKLQHRSEKNQNNEALHSCTKTEVRNRREALTLYTGTWNKTGSNKVMV